MKKYIILLILVAILITVLYDINRNIPKGIEKKLNTKKINNNLCNVLSDKLKLSSSLEEELVNKMKANYKKVNNDGSPRYLPQLPSLESVSSILDN
tara:strand:- start:1016 stop:1303 length:288 start_codon:yes stop_codon:yes gene_type:complete